ncbi:MULTISPECIES: lipid IV(A) 3-deoxy-D-manno-octulosonic acid transferase [Methylotenera]|uniref:lipid IV(A) 3-deoxy-D-manno-octulosonic acid transferase n=1 Tax=Methylotenera TaxID=359407 RepID=UPI0003789CE0|nr:MULTISPECIES: lipid IV(A) 3-deoxy-D-manno-octulosonic acid transferase [Methylotenera]
MSQFIYNLLLYLVLPFVPLKLWWRGIKQPAYRQHWAERFGFYRFKSVKSVIWLHCVSVGETRAAEPLIKALLLAYPNHQILLSHTTPTGRDASEQLFADSVLRVYLPYDLRFAVKRFLKHFQPKIGLLMETELWFNLIATCKKRDIPLLLLNARLSEKSAKGYAKLGNLVTNGLQSLKAVAAQTTDDAARLQMLGASNVTVFGNLKFDVKPPVDAVEKGLKLRHLFNANKERIVFLAASTREGEETLILEAIKGLNLLTIIVPRHPQRFDEVEALIKQAGLNYQRRSQLFTPIDASVQIILGDSMGELFSYYAACDFTFVGGSLLEFGGQNLIEAATIGKPILIGQHTYNFAEASKNAIAAGAAIQVSDVIELRNNIQNLLNNPQQCQKMQQASLDFSQASTGTTVRVMQLIATYLKT